MNTKSLRSQKRTRDALSARLSSALGARDQGLLTQTEYEEKICEIERSLGPHIVLEEVPLRDGGTRFVVRSSLTREIFDNFEYHCSWSPDW